MARLVIREGANVGAHCRLPADSGRVTLGRRKGVGLPIGDMKASRDHAEVVVEGGLFILRDLHSRNGTYLDGRKISDDEILEPGANIRIGNTVIELEDDGGIPEGLEIHGLEILERIGGGRMGVVYKARQVSMDRAVAVKVLNEKYSTDRAFVKRFMRESREAASLSHLNIIRVFDAGVAGDLHYFTMEYIDGTTVSRLIRREGRIPVDRALGIVRQVARALEHAHENGIIHRDVKPSGIMVTADDRVKVADLGISKAFDESSGETGLLGTPHYMSPEQASSGKVDVRTDVYSLGATFYHMLTGEVPFAFDGRDPRDVAKAHTTGTLPPVQEVESDIPDSVASIVERMMARDPGKRYPSMAGLLADLDKVISDREAHVEAVGPGESSVVARGEGSVRRKRKHAARRRPVGRKSSSASSVGIAVGIGVVVLVGIIMLLAMGGPSSDQPRRRAPSRTPGRRPGNGGGFRGLLFGGGTDYDRKGSPGRAMGSRAGQVGAAPGAERPAPSIRAGPGDRPGGPTTSPVPPVRRPAYMSPEAAGRDSLRGFTASEKDPARGAIDRTVRMARDVSSPKPAGPPRPLEPRVVVATYVGGAGDQKIARVGFTRAGGIYARGGGFTVTYDAVGSRGRVEGEVGRHDAAPFTAKPPLPRGRGKEVTDPRNGQTYRVGCRQVSPTLQQPFLVSSAKWSLWGWSETFASQRGLTADTRAYDVWPMPGGTIMAMLWCDGEKTTLMKDPKDLGKDAGFLMGGFRASPGGMATLFVLIDPKAGTPLAGRFLPSHVMHHAVDPWGRIYLPRAFPAQGVPESSLGFSAGRAGVAVLKPDLSGFEFSSRIGGMAAGEEGREELGHVALKGGLLVLGGTTAARSMRCVNAVQERPGGGQDGLFVVIKLWE